MSQIAYVCAKYRESAQSVSHWEICKNAVYYLCTQNSQYGMIDTSVTLPTLNKHDIAEMVPANVSIYQQVSVLLATVTHFNQA